MNRKKRTIGIILLLCFILVVPPVWITYREMRQATLDHALIEAIKTRDDKKTLALLAEGASGEARENEKPPTFKEALLHLLDHIRHVPPPTNQTGDDNHLPALLLCQPETNGYHSNLAVIQALLDHGAKVNDRDREGRTRLHYAAFMYDADVAHLLLERGADTEAKDTVGCTPLMYADAGVTKVLLEHGASVGTRDIQQDTPLIWAAMNQRLDKVRMLLEHGAQVSDKDNGGATSLFYVRNSKDPIARKIAALLQKYGAK